MPKFSIITATWNSEKTLPATLNSLEIQSCQDFESIVIDGGSSDGTVNIVKNSDVVNRFVSEKDKGIYDALNKGIGLATGEYVGFLHSDDLFASVNSLQLLHDHLSDKESDAAYCDLTYVRKDNVDEVVRYWRSGSCNSSRLKWGWMPPHPTFYMKKSLYDKYGVFDLSFKIAADYDSLVRYLFTNGITASYLPEVLVKMRVGGESNRSFRNIIRKSREDYRVMSSAGISPLVGMIGKNFSKLPQFFNKN